MILENIIELGQKELIARIDLSILGRAFGKSESEMVEIIERNPDLFYAFSISELNPY